MRKSPYYFLLLLLSLENPWKMSSYSFWCVIFELKLSASQSLIFLNPQLDVGLGQRSKFDSVKPEIKIKCLTEALTLSCSKYFIGVTV